MSKVPVVTTEAGEAVKGAGLVLATVPSIALKRAVK